MTDNLSNTPNSAETLEQKRQRLQDRSVEIIEIADNEPDSALRCIHLLSVAGGATAGTYKAIERRIVADQDTYGAYHLALMAQNTSDLPIDARQLITMVVEKGDNEQLLSLLKNLPIPPVEAIKSRIVASNDGDAIGKMNAYLQVNPDGYGSQVNIASGQKDRIVPLSPNE
ncbi:hypothetical protein [Psychrobacter pygoscelis]|uniref:hypothetical protein n=1 Tax=Psychrobacter pygoscelis TaxID=2488563 RepID=UPI00103E3D13|nr:hypothetical protein [Psychrobacter pygoscelis]